MDSGIQNYLFFDGFPISLTQRISPHMHSNRTRFDAFYVQDQWTKKRLTLQGALRYEHAWSWFPEGENGITAPSRYNAAPILFPDTVGVKGFHDITPRMGLAYDVFGNGKTSFKASFSKYLQPANNESVFIIGNPAVTFAQTTDRSWFDANGNYVADCDLNNSAGNGECGPWANGNFGKASSGTVVNPAVLEGWGSRPYDWQVAASIQQELMPRVSATFGYNRRSWGNFYYTDNRAVGPADFDKATITAPQHPDLEDGGGYPVSFYVVKENKFGAVDNYFTFAQDYGDVTYYWHGFDYDINARMSQRPRDPGRRHHRPRHPRHVRGRGDAAGSHVWRRLRRRPAPDRRVRGHRDLADQRPRPRQLHDPEDRRADERDLALGGQHRAADRPERGRDQRAVAERQLRCDVSAGAGGDRPATAGRGGHDSRSTSRSPGSCSARASAPSISG